VKFFPAELSPIDVRPIETNRAAKGEAMKTWISLPMVMVATIVAARAESPYSRARNYPQPATSPPVSYHHASTVHEGAMRGIANGIRAAGASKYNAAAAALIAEEARERYLANRVRSAKTFWDLRQLHASRSASQKSQPKSSSLIRTTSHTPSSTRRSTTLVTPGRPGFEWPEALMHSSLATTRERLTTLFSERSSTYRGASSENSRLIRSTAVTMRDLLKERVRDVEPMAYVQAQRFLTQLADAPL
jgi:hypothetical protein